MYSISEINMFTLPGLMNSDTSSERMMWSSPIPYIHHVDPANLLVPHQPYARKLTNVDVGKKVMRVFAGVDRGGKLDDVLVGSICTVVLVKGSLFVQYQGAKYAIREIEHRCKGIAFCVIDELPKEEE